MDALFESIKLRDLLPAGDLWDPASPLSAPDLRLLITRLESHSLQIKSRVQSYLLSHHAEFSSLFSLCNDAVSQTNEIDRNLSDLSDLVSGSPIDVEIREITTEIAGKMREAKEKKELLELVRVIVGISERMRGVREGVKNGRLRFAAEELTELKKSLRIGDEERTREPLLYGLLRNEWLDCFEEIQELLVRLMENGVQFDPDSGRVRVNYRLNLDGIAGIDLQAVLEAMGVVEILDYGLAKVADQMIKLVIAPAVNSGSLISFVEDEGKCCKEMTEAVFKIVPPHDSSVEDVEASTFYSGLLQVIKFIHRCICFQNSSWSRCFGRLTWPRISDLIILNFLSKAVPEDASRLADFQKIVEHTSEFEAALKEMMFIPASDDTELKLTNYAENVEVHFASRKKMEILAKARDLLLHCDFAINQEYIRKDPALKDGGTAVSSKHVVDLLFLSETCVVSQAALQLMELVHRALKDICLSSPRVALEFYHAARDAILLYEAVIPVKLERQLDSINHVAVLMHNDCLYLSQEIFGLAFQISHDGRGDTGETNSNCHLQFEGGYRWC
uniref:Centromere/kinetochore protein zw10 homolog n=1 Tax=Rhizophora mucronata TaxID=61149 RepID=A0A2P2LAB1_RHIMU